MKIDEMIQTIAKENPKLFSSLPPNKTKAIVRAILTCMRGAIEATPEGSVKIAGFGSFHVRQVEREASGEKVTRKVVVFRAAQLKK